MRVPLTLEKQIRPILATFVLVLGQYTLATTSLAETTSQSTRIENKNPVYVNGARVEADKGLHLIELRRNTGITVDRVLYMPDREDPPRGHGQRWRTGFYTTW